jgi:hypothetical protein
MIKKLFLAIAIATFSVSVFAQQVDEVALMVSGDGATKQEATQNALRSAIEQAFGVFVSANTSILDDELVKDEIATISSGNIKEYEEIVSAVSNGNASVTLKAIVSPSKLVAYAKSKGSSAEFAGATFVMNVHLERLNKANEEKAIANMISQLNELWPTMFDFEIEEISRPYEEGQNSYQINVAISIIVNKNTAIFRDILINTLRALSIESRRENLGFYCEGQGGVEIINKFCLRSEQSLKQLKEIDLILTLAVDNYKIVTNTGEILGKGIGKSEGSRMQSRRYQIIPEDDRMYIPHFCCHSVGDIAYKTKQSFVLSEDELAKISKLTVEPKYKVGGE